jgi:hypothetical protein
MANLGISIGLYGMEKTFQLFYYVPEYITEKLMCAHHAQAYLIDIFSQKFV